ncbi:hypothetical protein BY996DRAFT_4578957 [Phakopsora pachyrhizi]|nr:hypothetical protein BY996DRAFT_4578957 [Phakopsora pachyrhizi]
MEYITNTASNCSGGGSDARSSPHPSESSQPSFAFFQPQTNSLHNHSSRLFSHSTFLHTPPSCVYETFKAQDRPNSAKGLSRCSTESISPKSPPLTSHSVIASTASPRSLISESMGIDSSTPPISFDYPTPVSALSFPAPVFFPREQTPSSQVQTSVLPTLSNSVSAGLSSSNIITSSSNNSSFHPWVGHNSPSINHQISGSRFPSGSSHSHSDQVNSDKSSRRWTPEQSEIPQQHSSLPQSIGDQTQSLAALGSPVAIEQPNSPPLYIRIYSAFEPAIHASNVPVGAFSEESTNDHSQFNPNSLGLCSPLPHHSSSAVSHENSSPNIGVPPVWLETEGLTSYEESSNDCHQSRDYHFSVNHLTSPLGSSLYINQEVNRSAIGLHLNSRIANRGRLNTREVNSGYMVTQETHNDRTRLESSRLGVERSASILSTPRINPISKKKKRELKEDEAICGICGVWMARLTLRGSAEELSVVGGYEILHTCKMCQEKRRPEGPEIRGINQDLNPGFSNISSLERHDLSNMRLKPEGTVQTVPTTFRKRNRRTDDVTAPTTCDCCARQLGIGGIVPRNGRSAIQFAVEVVCAHCVKNFRRCTDCGGGGGSRLGVGKWRCKELFSDGRRTCVLSHQRQGASTETKTVVWRISDIIEKAELETLVTQIKELLKYSLYAALATPEMLESGLARVSNFEGIKAMYTNGWEQVEPLIREDVEIKLGRRRYLGLKWTKPHPRKGSKRLSPGATNDSQKLKSQSNMLLEPGKDLSGFVLSEWDMKKGTLFVSVAMPWQSGDALESTANLAHQSILQARADREKMIRSLATERNVEIAEVVKQYPPIEHLWTILFFSREARLVQFLEKRRKFLPLEDYLNQYPDAHRSMFPPERDCYVPAQDQMGWTVWVRRESSTATKIKKN